MIYILAKTSESYWKLMTRRRHQAIQETNIENQQFHSLIDNLSSENENLRVITNYCDYLQKILEILTSESDCLLEETNTVENPIG
ncbi:unnamed protein product [Rotaria magnacalcarata]|uniref:Uncharacterized protein n=1 Tax=Rotaria magnacalcarata TaxID=392030 RepID=A0A819NCR1_9BILA|nr:unnamed protein product [Rotaria magnacalcarata]CAF1686516.1 unnamed protein product [Rotaria magnacalcarata]CAF1957149.1 unnamed protein product [Rotaria magnacalcarata]CAF2140755.1 unnamed protein product [Rotaria magnacalcarata]CAF2209349.1 unnamed protein product [Rotaria magnacalcarata]